MIVNNNLTKVIPNEVSSIGCDCFYKSLTYILQCNRKIINAFSYIGYDFIYDFESLCTFETNMPIDKYFEYKPLYFSVSPNSHLATNYLKNIHKNLSNSPFFKSIEEFTFCYGDFENVISKLVEIVKTNNVASVLVNSYTLKPCYKNKSMRSPVFPTEHYVNITQYDSNKRMFHVIDNYYIFNGWISLETLKEAIIDLKKINIEPNIFSIINIEDNPSDNILLDAVYNSLGNKLKISNVEYKLNQTAIEELYKDVPVLLNVVEEKFGYYAPCFFSYPYVSFRHQIAGYSELIKILKKDVLKSNIYNLNELSDSVNKISKCWKEFDLILDTIALKKGNISRNLYLIKKYLKKIENASYEYTESASKLLENMAW